MDISIRYYEIQKKYGLLDSRVQELYLFEEYMKECINVFQKYDITKMAIYGAGNHTKKLLRALKSMKMSVDFKCIIDNNTNEVQIDNIPILKEEQTRSLNIQCILISSYIYREEMKSSLGNRGINCPVEDLYDIILQKYPMIDVDFWVYEGNDKYQWFAQRQRKLCQEDENKEEVLRELIHGFYAIYDWVDFENAVLGYVEENYSESKRYKELLEEVKIYWNNIENAFMKRTQQDCLIFLVDALSRYIVDEMPHLSALKEGSVYFNNYFNEYPSTREAVMGLFTGGHAFEHTTYKNKEVNYEDSELLIYAKENGISVKFLSHAGVRNNLKKISNYKQELSENVIISEVIFHGIRELLLEERRQLIVMHSYDTIHSPHWNPRSTRLKYFDASWNELNETVETAIAYTDDILHFYLSKLIKNKYMTFIVMGDHGINFETEYMQDIAKSIVKNQIGLWDVQTMSPALMICSASEQPRMIEDLVSATSLCNILYWLLRKERIEDAYIETNFLWLDFVPGYDESWINRAIKSGNLYFILGAKGILSKKYIFFRFENDKERLFEIVDKNLIECNNKIESFKNEVGENIYNKCCFPKEILRDDFFKKHNQLIKNVVTEFSQINIKNLDFMITERCSLKCRDCFNCMQYYETPRDIEIEKLIKSIDILTKYVKKISEMRILGGEPFMNRRIAEIVDYVCKKSEVDKVVIYTNATIMPTEEMLEIFKNSKVSFYITDYGLENQKIDILQKKLDSNNISYKVHKLGYWYKPGKIEKNGKSVDELKNIFSFCWGRDCITLLDGKLFHCELAANANRLKAIPDYRNDYIDLFNENELERKIYDYLYKKEFMNACGYCNLSNEKVCSGIQVTKNISYKRYE